MNKPGKSRDFLEKILTQEFGIRANLNETIYCVVKRVWAALPSPPRAKKIFKISLLMNEKYF